MLACASCAAASAAAPASVADSLYKRDDLSLGLQGVSTNSLTLLRADGTYQELWVYHVRNLDRSVTYDPPASGTYTYTVSGSNPDQATLTTSGAGQPLTFVTGLSGTVSGTGLYTFGFFPAIAPSGAVNVSNRAWVSATHVTTAGFVVGGTASRWVLLRAVGPSLTEFEVPTVVATPTLRLFHEQMVIGTWGPPVAGTAAGLNTMSDIAGAFPLLPNSADSVGLTLLAPGAYTVQSGGATTDAEVLMEVYILPFGG